MTQPSRPRTQSSRTSTQPSKQRQAKVKGLVVECNNTKLEFAHCTANIYTTIMTNLIIFSSLLVLFTIDDATKHCNWIAAVHKIISVTKNYNQDSSNCNKEHECLTQVHVAGYKYPGRATCIRRIHVVKFSAVFYSRIQVDTCRCDDNFVADTGYKWIQLVPGTQV